jgi:hypothetical protein
LSQAKVGWISIIPVPIASVTSVSVSTITVSSTPTSSFVIVAILHFGFVEVQGHVDEGLCQGYRVWIAGNGNLALGNLGITFRSSSGGIIALGNPDHCSGNLTNFGNLGTTFANDATNHVIGNITKKNELFELFF